MKRRKIDTTWPETWAQVQDALERHNAPDEVKKAATPRHVGWNYGEGRFYLFLPEILYKWIEVPPSPDQPSNLRFIKPILWPMMQRYNCRDLVYRVIETRISISMN